MEGALIVDKPSGMTSHDVVNRVRRLAGTRRVGHLGTLDPMATGVLPLLIDRATRLARFLSGGPKEYDAHIRFGYSTDTYDREGTIIGLRAEPSIPLRDMEAALARFQGTFFQTPPPVSAKKVNGTPAYKLARKQIPVELKPVEITVYEIALVSYETPVARVRIRCSAGTYIRSIAHELGDAFGCGAVLDDLRRTESCGFTVSHSKPLAELNALAEAGHFDEALVPLSRLLPNFPSETVDTETALQIRQGRDFRSTEAAQFVRALSPEGALIAIGESRQAQRFHPIVVL